MTSEELTNELCNRGLTQEEAGRLFGYSSRQILRWEKGDYPVPKTVAAILKAANKFQWNKRQLYEVLETPVRPTL